MGRVHVLAAALTVPSSTWPKEAGEAPASGPVKASGAWWDRLGLSHTAGLQGAALGSSLPAPHLQTMLHG